MWRDKWDPLRDAEPSRGQTFSLVPYSLHNGDAILFSLLSTIIYVATAMEQSYNYLKPDLTLIAIWPIDLTYKQRDFHRTS